MATKNLDKKTSSGKTSSKSTGKLSSTKSPELRSALVRVAHKLSSNNSSSQVVKIGEKYYRIKELG